MTIIHNGQKYEIPNDIPLPKVICLKVAISSPNTPETWVHLNGSYDSGCEFFFSVSKNILEKYNLEAPAIERVNIGLVDGKTREADMVLLNIIIKGISAGDVTMLAVPTLVTELDDMVVLGQRAAHFFRILTSETELELLAFNSRSIK